MRVGSNKVTQKVKRVYFVVLHLKNFEKNININNNINNYININNNLI